MVYFTKLKKLWDELSYLHNFPKCTYGATKVIADLENEDKLIQCLMCLNATYDGVVAGPLPNVNKAYSMVSQVEK